MLYYIGYQYIQVASGQQVFNSGHSKSFLTSKLQVIDQILRAYCSSGGQVFILQQYVKETKQQGNKRTQFWQVPQREDISLRTAAECTYSYSKGLSILGIITDQIEHLGQLYNSTATWPSDFPYPQQHTNEKSPI